jgi:hypothetical protein
MDTTKQESRQTSGFADLIVVLIAGAAIAATGLALHVTKDIAESELPDGWSYDQTIMTE